MKKLLIILALIIPTPALSANVDISTAPELGTAVSGDAILGVDASDLAGSRLARILFNGDSTYVLGGDGVWLDSTTISSDDQTATEVLTDTTAFGGNLSGTDTTVQAALDTLDDTVTGTDTDAIHDNVSGEISLITEKVTPVSADLLLIEDSAATNAKKRIQIGNLPGAAMTYPGAGIAVSTGTAWGTSYSTTTLAAALDGEDWTATGAWDFTGASSFITGPLSFEGSTVDTNQTTFSVTDPTAGRTVALGDFDMRVPAASAVNTDGSIVGMATEIASGTAALGTAEIADGACATVVTSTATGVATTDVIQWSFNADPTSVTGYNPSGGLLYIVDYPTLNTANFKVCNKSGAAITPGAITLNWRVDR